MSRGWSVGFDLAGGPALTGFGLLFWRKGDPHPNYANALVKGAAADSHTYTGLRPGTYQFRIHACNGSGSCGWWTDPPKEVVVPEPPRVTAPGKVRNLRFSTDHESFTVRWDEPSNNGGAAITGYGILQWREGTRRPGYGTASTVSGTSKRYGGLRANTKYWVTVHACNGPDRCGAWTGHTSVTTDPTPPTPAPTAAPATAPGPVTNLRHTGSGDNSVTVAWGAPSSDGGAALTGFHVKHRVLESGDWPDGAAIIEDGSARSRTIGGLVDGTLYDVQVRACNAASLCGGWTDLLSRDREIVAGHRVGNASLIPAGASIAVGERLRLAIHDIPTGKTAYAQMYGPIQPAGRCPSGRAVIAQQQRGPGPSRGQGYYDTVHIEGCAPGGIGWLRVVNAAETELYARATIRVGTRKPGQVDLVIVNPRDAALHVDWEAPSDGGSTITHYDVQYRAGTSGAWTQTRVPPTATEPVPTDMTISSLSNGAAYQVQVRACNTHGCGAWSDTATGTPVATAPAPPTTSPVFTPVDADCPETSSTATAAGPPQNLDVVPAPQRHILLCWTPVTPVSGNTSYLVQVSLNPTADTDDDRAWVAARTKKPGASGPPSTTDTAVTVDLTNVLLHTADRGLTTHQSIGFRIRAKIDSTRYEYSDMVVVIDSPIVAASVFRSNREEAHVSWRTAQTALLDDDYAQGTYDLRYWLVSGNRQDRNWTPANLGSREIKTGVSSPLTMKDLSEDRIYAIQLVYRKDNRASTHDADVYAARNVYVQTIEGPPVEYESLGPVVFAGFPMRFPMKTTTFDYRVCTETFPTGRESDWVDFIKHAFGQWELATNYTVISMHYNSAPCTNYATTEVTKTILDKIKHHTGSNEDLTAEVEGFIRQATTMTKLKPLHHADSRINEIVMLNDSEALGLGPAFESRVVWVYSQLGSDIGYLGSKGRESTNRKCWTEFPGCAVPSIMLDSDGVATGDGYSTDIFLLRSKVDGSLQIPGDDTSVNRSDVKLNRCPAGTSDAYGILVHEAGHALGLRSADGSDGHHRSSDSVMSGGNYSEKCSPYPLDVLAIRALYESR